MLEIFNFPTNFSAQFGAVPLAYSNIFSMPVWRANALVLEMTNAEPAFLQYNLVETNGRINLSFSTGTIILFVAPDWASADTYQYGTGPGQRAYFLAAGDWRTGSPNGFFGLSADLHGTNLSFWGMSNGVTTTYVNTAISWSSNVWHALDVESNRLITMLDNIGADVLNSSLTYTKAGQLATETSPWASDTATYSYKQGRRTNLSLTQPSGTWNQIYSYDNGWRLQTLTSPAGQFGYNYLAQSASALFRVLTLPNSASISNYYDPMARLDYTGLLNYWGHPLDGYAYLNDSWGLRTNITRQLGLTTNIISAGYDGIGELATWTAKESSGILRQNEQLAYAFDAAGNLRVRTNGSLVQTFTVNSLNQLSNVTRTGTFTVTGATPAPATSVTVNGVSAQTYGDFAFAGTNNTLANGNNTFTIIAQNVYGAGATNTLTVNLPTPVNFQYDANGNLTNDGARWFYCDADNRLTNITSPNQWQVVVVYDGLNRRRIERDYTWTNSAWLKTNESRFLYDGMQIIQERDTNNNPLVTYTRGLDLSMSLSRAEA